ncbi:MAG: DUF4214 domain-containing protein, partial [Rhodocyclaceae bacterium]|nr:DUF4214 domain-containing protein [Rhodocyclaceae bacterium]
TSSKAKPVDLSALLSMNGKDFVEHAYATLLGRAADEDGLQTYLGELERGTSKKSVLRTLAESAEGRTHAAPLDGLTEFLNHTQAKRAASLLGRLIGR